LKLTGKNISIEKSRETVRNTRDAGIRSCGQYIFGHPNETKSDILETVKMIRELNTDDVIIGIMTPWPGTMVYELAEENMGGYSLLHKNYGDYDKHYGNAIKFERFSIRWLEFMRLYSYLNMYIKNKRVPDLLGFLWTSRRYIIQKIRSIVLSNY
jgi:radical SAM superfamily enzyme YgiQ (UPF0313 family)